MEQRVMAKRRQPSIFTPQILSQIPVWVRLGFSPRDIARRVGCTEGSLRTMCSIKKISLSRVPIAPRSGSAGGDGLCVISNLLVSSHCMEVLRAKAQEQQRPIHDLCSLLLEQIANDDLFSAVLDDPEEELH